MAKNEHRIESRGRYLDYTCTNWSYSTNTEIGYAHGGRRRARGSVLPEPLTADGSYSLWLEHVVDKNGDDSLYWLMWYKDGVPQIPASGIFRRNGIKDIVKALLDVLE